MNIKLTPTFSDYKKLFQKEKNKGIIDFKEYIKPVIFDYIENQKDKIEEKLGGKPQEEINLSINNFKKLKNELKEKKEYVKVLSDYGLDFTYNLIDYLDSIFGSAKSLKEELEKNNTLEYTIRDSYEDIFLYLTDFFNIDNKEKLANFSNNKNIKWILTYGNIDNLKIITELPEFNIDSLDKNIDMALIFKDSNNEILKKTINIYNIRKIEDFSFLNSENPYVYFLKNGEFEIFEKLVNIAGNTKNINFIMQNNLVIRRLCYGGKDILMTYLNLCNNINDVIDLFQYDVVGQTLNMKNNSIAHLKPICNSIGDYIKLLSDSNFYAVLYRGDIKAIKFLIGISRNPEELIKTLNSNNHLFQYFSNNNIKHINLLSDIFKVKSLSDLENFFDIQGIAYGLKRFKSNNFEIVSKLCSNNSDLKKALKNKKIYKLLEHANVNNLEYICDLYKVKNIKELVKIVNNRSMYDIIYSGKLEKLDDLFDIGKDKENFKKLFKNKKFIKLASHYNYDNIKIILQFYKTKSIDDIIKVLNTKGISYIINNGHKENIKYLIKLTNNTNDFNILLKNKLIIDIIQIGLIKNIKIINKIFKITNTKEFLEIYTNKNFPKILAHSSNSNIKKIFGLAKNKNDIKLIINNKKIISILEYTFVGNLENILKYFKIKDITQLITLISKKKYLFDLLIESDVEYIIELIKFIEGNYSFKNLKTKEQKLIKYQLFAINSYGKSNISNYLFDKLSSDKKKGIYDIIHEDIDDFFEENEIHSVEKDTNNINKINKQFRKNNTKSRIFNFFKYRKLGIDRNKIEISMYLRYGHTVDHPEIGEYIVLFVNEYIKRGYSKYLSGVRIIPYSSGKFPREGLFKGQNIKKYNVSGSNFELALKKYSIPFHLSHSSYKNTENYPYIVSNSMDNYNKDEDRIQANFDLEESYDKNNTGQIELKTIFIELIRILKEIDKKLDKK